MPVTGSCSPWQVLGVWKSEDLSCSAPCPLLAISTGPSRHVPCLLSLARILPPPPPTLALTRPHFFMLVHTYPAALLDAGSHLSGRLA